MVSGRFSRSCSLGSLFLVSILKLIAFASFLRLWELGVCLVLLPDSTTRHLRVGIYSYRSISLYGSIASLVKRPFYF